MKQNNKQQKKKQSKHSLLPLKDDPYYLVNMNEFGINQLVPRLVKEIIQNKIDLQLYGQYLLDPNVFPRIIQVISYLYNVNLMQYNSNIQYAYYLQQNGLEQTVDMGLLATLTNNNLANATVYSNIYQALYNYASTGDYTALAMAIGANKVYTNQISGIDTAGTQVYQRIENKSKRESQQYQQKGRRYNDRNRSNANSTNVRRE